ncbi:cytochrome o ubiquinol oxidase subunit IV [Buchnera aphidicola (Diuraphis noxia)]|uniref:Cytochrome bo(3) ubiquinol oxidase subunit 4 n=1 Tax=Buchnera aphidicola subsp. Diuraphis noxia TaxID=118101 RepID=A0A1B2H958_BUCDN|nr:cytochrome o ubiquinol oxidase subunit IV [Buchnera aphidicola]ANZ22658.1 cytochrome o ubiquinol oxidase subunit IV [Buchnera aphidicola (Diuraphis noxia)]
MYNSIKKLLNSDKKLKSYLLGCFLSFILTTLSFLSVIQKLFSNEINHLIILLLAISQIIVHFIYFLHLNFSKEKQWHVITLLFVMIIMFILVFGSIWIMSNLNHHV